MTNRVLVRTAVLLIFVASSGCAIPSHIHSPANANAAREARDAMIEYGKGAPKMYSAMLANVDRFKAEEEWLLSELAANVSDSLVTKLPSMKWSAVGKRADGTLEKIGDLRRDFAKAVGAAAPAAAAAKLEAQVVAAREAVKRAKQNVTDWNASVAVLQASLLQLVVSGSAQSGPKSLTSLSDAISTVGNKQAEYFDADGKKVTQSVAEVARGRVPALLLGLQSGDRQKSLLEALPDAPGLELVIVNLGLELAELEQRRTQAQRADAAALLELLEDMSAQIAVAETLLKPVATWIAGSDPALGARPPGDDNVFTSIEAVRASTEGRPLDRIDSTSLYLVWLREVAVAESIVTRVSSTSTVALARFAHTRSIREASINDVQYQALIRSGLDGLAAYHAGGLKSEDIANLIRFAQAVGVAVIAGGVY